MYQFELLHFCTLSK